MIRLMNGSHSGPMNIWKSGEFTIRQLAELVRALINPDLQLSKASAQTIPCSASRLLIWLNKNWAGVTLFH